LSRLSEGQVDIEKEEIKEEEPKEAIGVGPVNTCVSVCRTIVPSSSRDSEIIQLKIEISPIVSKDG